MAQKKAYEVEAWLARPDPRYFLVLVYGPDHGLVAERTRGFAERTGIPLDDPFSTVRMEAGEAERDSGRLLDEAHTVPMFAERRLLWLRNAGAHKGLADDVKSLLAAPPRDAVVLIEAGDLKKGSPLRAAVEGADNAMALPCYADENRDLDALIDRELTRVGMTMALDARQTLRRNLGADRLASVGEIEKLALYANGAGTITLEDVRALVGDVSGQSFEDAVDAVLEGRIDDFDSAFTRQCQTGGPPFLALAGAMRQFQALHAMRGTLDTGGRNAAAVVAAQRPPVFYARRKLVEKALERWTMRALERALARLHAAVLQTRRRPDLQQAVARQALLAIAVESARLGRN